MTLAAILLGSAPLVLVILVVVDAWVQERRFED